MPDYEGMQFSNCPFQPFFIKVYSNFSINFSKRFLEQIIPFFDSKGYPFFMIDCPTNPAIIFKKRQPTILDSEFLQLSNSPFQPLFTKIYSLFSINFSKCF